VAVCQPLDVAFFGIRFDLRNPEVAGTTMAERYAAALDMAEWADRIGLAFVVVSEHHGSPDGYLPSPLVLASAIAARTERIAIHVAAMVAAFHDPLRLAEDAAVADLVSQGRLELVIANGYVAEEFAMFGVPMGQRASRTSETVQTLRQAWTGEPFEFRGRTVQVTPRPFREAGPGLSLGGSSDAAARRAARLGVGFRPSTPDVWEAYRAERIERGGSDPGPYLGGDTSFTFLAEDVDAGWEAIAPFALHEANAYGAWAEAAGTDTGYRTASDADALRATGQYRVVTPGDLVAELTAAGPFAVAVLHPMMGGIPPELGWASLRLLERDVLPHLPR
jgi:alkanesulfonate monooxygenase SsuD/methylene tetrahydromethanopterin reductase-like flavin-dependent oxidoreductase (luciferase family)